MRDLTQGSITRTIIAMAAPVAFGMLFQTLYLLVDLYFVAALGDAAVAGVGAAGTLMFMIMAVTQVLSVSSVALMSQAVGRKDQAQANLVFNQSMLLAIIFTVVTLVFGLMLRDLYMSGITSDPAAREQGVLFMTWFVPSMALQFPMMGMASALRATGIVKPGMMVQMVTVLLNTALAPVLIAGWGTGVPLGVLGAGMASMISISVGILMLLVYFVKLEKYVSFSRAQWTPDFAVWKRMVGIGLPAGGEMLLMFVYFALVYWLIQDFGAPSQAGFSIGGRIMQSIFMPTMAVAFAIGPIVGQNFGAGRHDRVREACKMGMVLNSIVMAVVTILVHIDPTFMVEGFTSEPEVIAVGADFLRIISWNFVMQGIVFSCSGMFQGLGNTRPALLSTICRLGIFIPLAYVLSKRAGFEVNHIWYASVLSVFSQGIISFLLVRRELRLKLKQMPAAEVPPAVKQRYCMNGAAALKKAAHGERYSRRINKVLDYIHAHLDDELSVDTLSRVANFSRFHFHRQFSEYTGITVTRLVQLLRLRRASMQLVFNQRAKVTDIAFQAGFANAESFSRAFRREHGQTPTAFRKNPTWTPWQVSWMPQPSGRLEWEVEIVDFPTTRMAVVEHVGPRVQVPMALMKLNEWREANDGKYRIGAAYGIYPCNPETTPPDQFRAEFGLAVDRAVAGKHVVNKAIPAGRCAAIRNVGAYDTTAAATWIYRQWLPDSGEQLRPFPMFCEFVNAGIEVPENAKTLDIYLPLR